MSAAESTRTCLHLVVSAHHSALADCLNQRTDADSVVFIDGGVMHLLSDTAQRPDLAASGFFFSHEDLEARGLMPFAREQGVQTLDDRATVRLLRQHDHCLTWK